MNLGSKLKLHRKKSGLTQIEFAQKTNTSVATLRRWESGQTSPDATKIFKIAEVLNIKPEELFSDNSYNSPEITIKNSDKDSQVQSISPNEQVKIKVDETGKNMIVIENKSKGIRFEIPPTKESYEFLWKLYGASKEISDEINNSD